MYFQSSNEEENDDEEFALLMRKFNKFVKKDGFHKKNFSKGKTKKFKKTCYECEKKSHFIAECPNANNKDEKEKKNNKEYKKDKGKKYNKQTHIGQKWDSDSDFDSEEGGIATLAIGVTPPNISLFRSLSDEEEAAPTCLMTKESKVLKLKLDSSNSENDDDMSSFFELMNILEKQRKEIERQKYIF